VFKKREREIKNTDIYTGSPFLKGYIQSFANKQRVPLIKITKISSQQYKTLTTHKIPLFLAANNLLHPATVVQTKQNPSTQTQLQTLCNIGNQITHNTRKFNLE